ncbi:hypothetical protein RHVG_00052 [Rhodovulum phage RS1]|uniref:minor tail protein n=1 Tax=Rhodobacter phage RC1 TaxID=754055 RepID=UPI0002C18A8B|nr:minor tail protein [Rhodobacter phage RC1]YP_007676431.1 minor tail protein [Rhodovulum phage RS1]AGH58017.1 hypothetical protein RHVG_00052 [Rhodovulum phage RS1]AGH58026.1 hypothetical protein RHWG_00005 [Rhodobacter phage RC1]
MSRRLSLNARLAQEEVSSEDIEVVLIEITHPSLSQVIRLSTDNTVRLSDDPLIYGTRSTWRGADPATDPYLWILASAVIPGDQDDAPAAAKLVLDNLDAQITEVLRSYTDLASINMAVVLAASPDELEAEFLDLKLVSAEGDESAVTLHLSREEIELEHFPAGRMILTKFPGLHR